MEQGGVMEGMSVQCLFGQYMSVHLPIDRLDVSDVREIPDNQEVYTHSGTDQSIIIEILEHVEKPDEEALKIHFEDVADSNKARDEDHSDVTCVEKLSLDKLSIKECKSAWFLRGLQKVSKFNECDAAKNLVNIYMVLYRLPQFSTDLVVSFNDPVNISPHSSSYQSGGGKEVDPWTLEQFQKVFETLHILNTDIFGGEDNGEDTGIMDSD